MGKEDQITVGYIIVPKLYSTPFEGLEMIVPFSTQAVLTRKPENLHLALNVEQAEIIGLAYLKAAELSRSLQSAQPGH